MPNLYGMLDVADEMLSQLQKKIVLFNLLVRHPSALSFSMGLRELHKAGICSSENKQLLSRNKEPFCVYWVISDLNEADILTQKNFEKVCADPIGFYDIPIASLLAHGLLTQEMFDLISSNLHRKEFAQGISYLRETMHLSQDSVACLVHHIRTDKSWFTDAIQALNSARHASDTHMFISFVAMRSPLVCQSIIALHEASVLNSSNLKIVYIYGHYSFIPQAILALHQASELTQSNLDILTLHVDKQWLLKLVVARHNPATSMAHICKLINVLNNEGILSKPNCSLLLDVDKSWIFERAITWLNATNIGQICHLINALNEARILTQTNLGIDFGINRLEEAILSIHQAGILTQDNFDVLNQHEKPMTLATLLIGMHQGGEITEDRRLYAVNLADAYIYLEKIDSPLLMPIMRALVEKHAQPKELASAFYHIYQGGILNSNNIDALNGHLNILAVSEALSSRVVLAGALAQHCFNLLIIEETLQTYAYGRNSLVSSLLNAGFFSPLMMTLAEPVVDERPAL